MMSRTEIIKNINWRKKAMRPWVLWSGVLAWRILWSVWIVSRTFFVADEYFQSVEMSHLMVYGVGEVTHEWRAPHPIRSSVYPLLLALPMKLWHTCGGSYRWEIPLVLQACLAACGDWFVVGIAERWFGRQASMWALLLNLTSWSVLYCWGRTLSNSVEAIATLAILAATQRGMHRVAAALMAINFVVRPTSALPWVIWSLFVQPRSLRLFLWDAVPAGLTALTVCALADRLYFGFWTLSWINFFVFNLNSSAFYGVHAWHWYLSSGWPTLLLSHMLLFAFGLWHAVAASAPLWPITIFVMIPTLFLSAVPHKEFRFLMPSHAIAIIYCAAGAVKLVKRPSLRGLLWISIAVNLGAAVYFSAFHQRGPIAATSFLAPRIRPGQSVGLLVPCHNVPAYCRLHVNVTLHQLLCDPGTHGESDAFFDSITSENAVDLVAKLLERWEHPDYVVIYEPLFDAMDRLSSRWERVMTSFHAHLPADSRHGRAMAVYQKHART